MPLNPYLLLSPRISPFRTNYLSTFPPMPLCAPHLCLTRRVQLHHFSYIPFSFFINLFLTISPIYQVYWTPISPFLSSASQFPSRPTEVAAVDTVEILLHRKMESFSQQPSCCLTRWLQTNTQINYFISWSSKTQLFFSASCIFWDYFNGRICKSDDRHYLDFMHNPPLGCRFIPDLWRRDVRLIFSFYPFPN